MIPKIIHYCWYGQGKKDDLTKRCIESWKRYCPDYEIIEWNEENSDFSNSQFAIEAYSEKKWAFVSDYWRLKALENYGGIYLDTDVELLNSLDAFLDNEAFFGYADDTYVGSGVIGGIKNNYICNEFLNYYKEKHFIKKDGGFNDIPNNQIYTAICVKKFGLTIGNDNIKCGNTKIYPSDYFSPFKKRTIGDEDVLNIPQNFDCSKNTCAIHYTVCSWKKSVGVTVDLFINQLIRNILPRKIYFALKKRSKIKLISEIEI